ncbi:MAG: hypothetical protein ABI145_07705 [Steroidobacteraceae bacterium]
MPNDPGRILVSQLSADVLVQQVLQRNPGMEAMQAASWSQPKCADWPEIPSTGTLDLRVMLRARHYLTTYVGLRQPWRDVLTNVPDLTVRFHLLDTDAWRAFVHHASWMRPQVPHRATSSFSLSPTSSRTPIDE